LKCLINHHVLNSGNTETPTATEAVEVRELDVAGEQGRLKAHLYVTSTKIKRGTLVVFFLVAESGLTTSKTLAVC
jgi:hypothetical protein